MSAQSVSETIDEVAAERKAAVVDAMKVLLLADAGAAVHVSVTDIEKWEQLKETLHPSRVRLLGRGGLKVCEWFIHHLGEEIVINANGPDFYPSRAQHERMLDERDENEGG